MRMPWSSDWRLRASSLRRPTKNGRSCSRPYVTSSRRAAVVCPSATGPRRTSRSRCERDEQAAVVVVGGEEVGGHRLLLSRPRADLQLLPEPADAPLERERGGVAVLFEPVQAESLD